MELRRVARLAIERGGVRVGAVLSAERVDAPLQRRLLGRQAEVHQSRIVTHFTCV